MLPLAPSTPSKSPPAGIVSEPVLWHVVAVAPEIVHWIAPTGLFCASSPAIPRKREFPAPGGPASLARKSVIFIVTGASQRALDGAPERPTGDLCTELALPTRPSHSPPRTPVRVSPSILEPVIAPAPIRPPVTEPLARSCVVTDPEIRFE